jgi:hypothetical protein
MVGLTSGGGAVVWHGATCDGAVLEEARCHRATCGGQYQRRSDAREEGESTVDEAKTMVWT